MADELGPIKLLAHRVPENGRDDRVTFATSDGTVCAYLTYSQWRQLDHADVLLVALIEKDW